MKFLHNVWYLAAYSHEISRTLLARKIIGQPILMYRRQDGGIAALSNHCPHRFAPLDRGQLTGDIVQCPYHGLEFGPDGRCVRNPHSDRVGPRMQIRSYPVVERCGMVWVWPGEKPATLTSIPDMSEFVDREGAYTTRSYLAADYRYDILIDNLLDLSHADYLHKGSFSSGPAEKADTSVSLNGDDVTVQWTQRNMAPPPLLKGVSGAPEAIDSCITMEWSPSQVIRFRLNIASAGRPFPDRCTTQFYHVATPADASHTHYFMGVTRFGPPDTAADRMMGEAQLRVISTEDGPMLEAIDRFMAGRELADIKPASLPVDAGAMQARAVMKRLFALDGEGGVETELQGAQDRPVTS